LGLALKGVFTESDEELPKRVEIGVRRLRPIEEDLQGGKKEGARRKTSTLRRAFKKSSHSMGSFPEEKSMSNDVLKGKKKSVFKKAQERRESQKEERG